MIWHFPASEIARVPLLQTRNSRGAIFMETGSRRNAPHKYIHRRIMPPPVTMWAAVLVLLVSSTPTVSIVLPPTGGSRAKALCLGLRPRNRPRLEQTRRISRRTCGRMSGVTSGASVGSGAGFPNPNEARVDELLQVHSLTNDRRHRCYEPLPTSQHHPSNPARPNPRLDSSTPSTRP